MAACDHLRYEGLGCTEYHGNCRDILPISGVGYAPTEAHFGVG